ncbi:MULTISPECIES: helix-turn-helix domain-containing protein [Streptococcus]|uniref:helix-turn-helix domain-containing protein n=1 Tax=Streptococcus TaxID=1301 RepID=UPI001612424A|nr:MULTISPECIES: helix-turn-helix transcriptional regulator [Streptococcus]MBM7192447.1 helix-turn-helix transcriptional regulator [Streptococcus suis]MBY0720495.1 helix-turn-helix domain-containing protein [Streptococcus sp. 2018110]MCO8184442.1 helix-turn-helix domain-containing protein [Streptococcus suis]MCO8215993.1 helix-turn-helix domain-containing protein [Streptococcus suis]MCO8224410.1 helix-turn-helix domain-containing protein [Streptococcus suis]
MLGTRLQTLRIDNGKNKEELSIYLNMTVDAYSRYETGKRQPSVDNLVKIAIFYGVSLDYLLGRDDIEIPVFDRESVVSYRDFVELGVNPKLAHGIVAQIDGSKPFEERIRRSVDDKTKFVTRDEVKALLKGLFNLL